MCSFSFVERSGRRRLLLAGTGLLAAASVPGWPSAEPVAAADTPEAALQLLTEGNQRYVANQARERDFSARRAMLAKSQAPFAAILGCADSRVSPELAFDQRPGDLFVVRVAGNFVTEEGLASLEFGAAVLGTKLIMVLGHSSCGAVDATVEALQKGNTLPGRIAGLVQAMKPGVEAVMNETGSDLNQRAVVANVRHNVRRLQNEQSMLTDLASKGKIRVVGGVYQLDTGQVVLV